MSEKVLLTQDEANWFILYTLQESREKHLKKGALHFKIMALLNKHNRNSRINRETLDESLAAMKSWHLVKETTDGYTITMRGVTAVTKNLDLNKCMYRLENHITSKELLARCRDEFNEQKYEDSIFKAFKFVEEQVRKKSGASVSDIGAKLMALAFQPKSGKLIIPNCEDPGEEDGIYSLFRGGILMFKNPSSHRTVNYSDPIVTLKILLFAELLLDYINQAHLRT